ncbi:MAG: tRNA (guanosine(37)-N1)-methyltransferase TrmD [Candidatus Paceibacterota bacterium]
MTFNIITIFPEAFSYLDESILKRAQKKGLLKVKIHNLRDFAKDKHHKVDGKPYGGGPGMVLKIEPLIKAVQSLKSKMRNKKSKVILFAPAGKQLNNKLAADFAKKYDNLILISGHYEGIDERAGKVISAAGFKVEEISIGPYVLGGGELPAMVLIDAVSRHIPGVLGKEESLEEKRLGVGVPAYTRPEIFVYKGKKYPVPKILLSGNHAAIAKWRINHRQKRS